MARYSVNNYTVENLLSSLGDPVNTVIAISPASGGGYLQSITLQTLRIPPC